MEASAGTTRPPTGVIAEDAAYGLIGARIEALFGTAWTLTAQGQAGAASETREGRWLYGHGAASYADRLGPLSLLGDASAFALRYSEPYHYDARAARLEPAVRLNLDAVYVTLRGDLARGEWSSTYDTVLVDVPGRPSETVTDRGSLRIDGIEGVVGGALGPVGLELGGHLRNATNGVLDGTFGGGTVAAVAPVGPANVFGSVQVQQTPDELELGYDAGVVARLSDRVQLIALLAHVPTDPLFGTRSGVGVSLGVSMRAGTVGATARPGIATVGPLTDGRRTVAFRVRDDADALQLAGSFSGWTPLPMERRGGVWTLDVAVEPGTYQFAFVRPDGTWFLPKDAPGVVDDGFGRSNATLVVPPL